MRDELRGLHERAGRPAKGALKRHADEAGHSVGESTLIGVVSPSATGALKWQTVLAFVDACLGYAQTRSNTLVGADGDRDGWRVRWERAYSGGRPVPRTVDALDAYLARLRDRYGQLDIDTLSPLDSQEDPIPVGVRDVFVVQTVRADPPPVELPRELWQRLAESGAVEASDLPEHLDSAFLARVRQSYEARPAQPVLDVLAAAGGQRMVVLGDPGAGKSTLARYLAVALAQRHGVALPASLDGLLPVLIELRSYAEPRWRDSSFLDYLDHQHRYTDDRLGLPRVLLEQYLSESGRALVVFDGLDELFEPKDREAVAHQITGFAARYPGARVLVTSRPIGYQRKAFDTAGFGHYMLQDLDRDQIAVFARRWYWIACPGSAAEAIRLKDRLLAAIDASRAVRELAGNPLLLTIMAVIGRRRELPRDRRNVYEHAVTVLVEHWEVSKHLAAAATGLPELDREDKLELLRLVAHRMQDGPAGLAGNHIAGADLLATFETYLHDSHALAPGPARVAARTMLEQFRHRNFILSRFGGQVYGFVHRAFLEFLAAADIDIRFANRELSETDLIEGVFGRRYKDAAWHEVLLLLAGMREHFAGAVIDHLLAADPLWYLRPGAVPQHLLLAVGCLGEIRKPGGVNRQTTAVARILTGLLEAVADQGHDSALPTAIRRTILPVLASLGPRWAGRGHYLDWYRIRSHAIADSEPFPTETVPLATLIAAAFDPSDAFHRHLRVTAILAAHPTMRRAALEAVAAGWADDPDTLPLLRDRATNDNHPDVRQAAVRAVAAGWADDSGALFLLRDRAVHDPEGVVRQAAVRAVAAGRAGDPDTLPLLRDRATNDNHGDVRRSALQAVAAGWVGDPGSLLLLHDRAVNDPEGVVRQAAVRAVAAGRAGDPGSLLLLHDRATSDPDGLVRQAATQAVASGWADDPGTPTLLHERATADPHRAVRRAAVRLVAAGWPHDPNVLPWLQDRVTADPDELVRQAATLAVATYWAGETGALKVLHDRIEADPDAVVRQTAIQALAAGWADDPDTPILLYRHATMDEHEDVRKTAMAAVAVGWADDPGTLPLLHKRATTDSHPGVRVAGLETVAVGWADDPGTLSLLHERATIDPHHAVRRTAMRAVAAGWADDPDTLPLLHECATADSSWDVRQAAIRVTAAGYPDDPSTLGLLHERATSDSHPGVREAALQAVAVGWAADPRTLPLLHQRATADGSWIVRQAALRAAAAGWADDPGTLSLLHERAATDNHADVRRVAVQAIAAGWPEDEGTLPLLRERLDADPDGVVRHAAVQAVAAGWAKSPGTMPWLHERIAADNHWIVRQAAVQSVSPTWETLNGDQ